MQPGADQWGEPIQSAPQQQVMGHPNTIAGQPAVGFGTPMVVGETQSTNAMVGLVLGILGIIGSLFYGLGCLCGVIGLVITYGAKKITDANPMHPDKGTVKAALITNWIAVILAVLGLVAAGVLYVWAVNLANEAGENGLTLLTNYEAEDASGEATGGTSDSLIQLELNGPEDLNWAFTEIQLTVNGTVHQCTTGSGDNCTISQGGAFDDSWETGEFIVLNENDIDICDEAECYVDILVNYKGDRIPGDAIVVVS